MGKAILVERDDGPSDSEIAEFKSSLCKTMRVKGAERPKTEAELRCEAKGKLTRRTARKLVPRYSLYALRHS